jgi:capsular polysaccharide biosynthesis protein
MKRILIASASDIFYTDTQRTTFFILNGKLQKAITYPEKRREPEINLILSQECSDDREYVAQAQYKWSANCSHLLYDVLSDYFVMRRWLGCNALIHRPTILSKQIIEYLNADLILGVDEVSIQEKAEYCHLEIGFKEIGTWRHAGHQHSYLSYIIRDTFKSLMVEDVTRPKNIIVMRRLTPSHPIKNRNLLEVDRILKFFERNGFYFETVYLEDLSLSEQIACFYNANIIISIHGSGLVWLNFCQECAKVIEIFPPWFSHNGYLKHDFWIVGNQRKLDYKCLYVDNIVGDKNSAYDFDVIVDPEILLELILN